MDDLLKRLALTIDERESANIHRDLVVEISTDVAFIPLYFQVTPLLVTAGVIGPVGGTTGTWNIHEWDKK